MRVNIFKVLATAALITLVGQSYADDTELYVGDSRFTPESKPMIMIIFDNSGSMRGLTEIKEPYEAGTTYEVVSQFDNSLNEDFVYFTIGLGVDSEPPRTDSNDDTKRFHMPVLGCDTARQALAKYGVFTGYIREHEYRGNTGKWVDLKENSGANTISALDCVEDVHNQYVDNTGMKITIGGKTYDSASDSLLQGLPIDNASKQANNFYTGHKGTPTDAEIAAAEAAFDGTQVVTLYHPNYLRWYHAQIFNTVNETRLDTAKRAVDQLVNTAPVGDYAVMVFNYDFPAENTRDGGRIISGFNKGNQATVDSVLSIEAETNTPLCETLYEAYRYFSGSPVLFGDDDTDCNSSECGDFAYKGNTPPYDTSVITDGVYNTPFREGCARQAHIILVTDGSPTLDQAADELIKERVAVLNQPDLPEGQAPEPIDYGPMEVVNPETGETNLNYLPVLAEWMYENDVSPNVEGTQNVVLHTIGFGDAALNAKELLETAAKAGGGNSVITDDPNELYDKLVATINDILKVSSTFTSAAVASNNFDRTQTLDSVYYSMFLPQETARWGGNVKKLKFSGGKLVDSNNLPASNESNGSISVDAVTYWTLDGTKDGNDVEKGGASAVLSTLTNRKIYSDAGNVPGAVMPEFTKTNASAKAGSAALLAQYMGVQEAALSEHFNWVRGLDVDDDDGDSLTTDMRSDIMGDPLHSKPLAIAYQDGSIRIAVGTNAGSFHLFKDNGTTLEEEWSFIPYELYPNLNTIRTNPTGVKVYGMDGSPVMYFDDVNGNGLVDTASDTVWLFTGMRRGGNSYYAFDISSPTSPKLMWKIDQNSPGMSELGQTWSQPKVTFVKANGTKPVLVFGGGYDINKDNETYSTDNSGRGIFIVDAETGALVWKTTPAITSSANHNTQYAGVDSVPGGIGMIDSDFDGFTDRLYASDTGGNVWRVDMPGSDPFSDNWSVVKLAQLSSAGDQRRFFYEPVVARTYYSKVTETTITENGMTTTQIQRSDTPYEAVLVGSGNRAHPSWGVESNALFMIRDEHIITESLTGDKVPTVVVKSDLMDITNDPFTASLNDQTGFVELEKSLATYKGWQYNLAAKEKALAQAVVVGGIAYFTTFTPNEATDYALCKLEQGGGKLYGLHLHYGAKVFNTLEIPGRIPDTPQLFFSTADGKSQFSIIENTTVKVAEQITDDGRPTVDKDGNPTWTKGAQLGFETHRTYIYQQESGN